MTPTLSALASRRCHPLSGGAPPLTDAEVRPLLTALPQWRRAADGKSISREYAFGDFYETMSFVNAVAHVANVEDHHPDLLVSYGKCRVTFSTHGVGGLSENDFVCAAKVESLPR